MSDALRDAMEDFARTIREASRKVADYGAGITVRESWFVPRDQILVFNDPASPVPSRATSLIR
jgi:hypothetical protein